MIAAELTLAAIFADCAEHFRAAARYRRSPFHTPVVGTADGDMRVMVLRAWDEDAAGLRFQTDARSPKLAVLDGDPRVSALFYDAAAKVQLRCRGRAIVDRTGAGADAAWAATSASSRRAYLTTAAPGTIVPAPASGLPESVEGRVPPIEQTEQGRANFALITVVLDQIDWLFLAATGHRRALFTRAADGQWHSQWMIP